jgi:Na+-translocating ferredoxin:NAD+ oxidoreductase RnfA subunit
VSAKFAFRLKSCWFCQGDPVFPEGHVDGELSGKYWELGNAIVAFSVLQMLAFLFSLPKKEFRTHVVRWFWSVVGLIMLSSIAYLVAVGVCFQFEIILRGEVKDPVYHVLLETIYARAIVIAYAALGVGTLNVGRRQDRQALIS